MISLTRTQVKAMLDIMSKDNSRPAIENAKVIQYNDTTYLTGTDGYVMFLLEVDADYASMVGKGIHRSEIERWYKLATGKDRLTEEVLNDMHYNDENFPDVSSILDRASEGGETDRIGFNADYAKKVQTLFGASGLQLQLNGKLGAMVYKHDGDINKGLGILMPLKG